MFFNNTNVTVFMLISYTRNEEGGIDKVVHCFLSDVLVHSSLFVEAAMDCLQLQIEGSKGVKQLIIWSDGCASQFKSCKVFALHAMRSVSMGIHIFHLYFSSGHGKGDHDGQAAVIKRYLREEASHRTVDNLISCAADCKKFLDSRLSQPKARSNPAATADCKLTSREFHLLTSNQIEDVTKPADMKAVRGTQKLHSVWFDCRQDKMRTRLQSCCAAKCMVRGECGGDCPNQPWVCEWEEVTLEQLNKAADEEDDSSSSRQEEFDEVCVTELIKVGGVFAVSTASVLQREGKKSGNQTAVAAALEAAAAVAQSDVAIDLNASGFLLVSCSSPPSQRSLSANDKAGDGWATHTWVVEGRVLQDLKEVKDQGVVFSLEAAAAPIQFDCNWIVLGGIELEQLPEQKRKKRQPANVLATEQLLSTSSHDRINEAAEANSQ